MITIYPPRVRADATALVVYMGLPNRTVEWTLTGDGVLTPLSVATDVNGQAAAIYEPGTPGATITIEVESGA